MFLGHSGGADGVVVQQLGTPSKCCVDQLNRQPKLCVFSGFGREWVTLQPPIDAPVFYPNNAF